MFIDQPGKNTVEAFKQQLINDIWYSLHFYGFIGFALIYFRYQQIGATYSMAMHSLVASFMILFYQFSDRFNVAVKAMAAGVSLLMVGIPSLMEFGFYSGALAWFLLSLIIFTVYFPTRAKYVLFSISLLVLVAGYSFVVLKHQLPFDANSFIGHTSAWVSSIIGVVAFLLVLKYSFSRHKNSVYQQREVSENLFGSSDSLTSKEPLLLTNNTFESKAENEFKKYIKTREPFTVLIVEVDQAKQISDTFGESAFNSVLVSLSRTLKFTIKDIEMVTKQTDNGFELLLCHADFHCGRIMAERLRNAATLSKPIVDGHAITVTASIGMATVRSIDSGYSEVSKRAYTGVYNAKNMGSNSVFYS